MPGFWFESRAVKVGINRKVQIAVKSSVGGKEGASLKQKSKLFDKEQQVVAGS